MIGNCVITIGKNTVRAFLRAGTQGPVAGLKRRISPWGMLGASTPAKYINKVTVFRGGTLRNCFRAPGECLPGSTNARSA